MMNYQKLFERNFTIKDKNYTLENTLRYWRKFAANKGISPNIMELAIARGFRRLAGGEVFPERCDCGCGGLGIGTAFVHFVDNQMVLIDTEIQSETGKILNKRFNIEIEARLKQLSKTDKQFIKMNRPPLKERSPILRGIRKWIGSRS